MWTYLLSLRDFTCICYVGGLYVCTISLIKHLLYVDTHKFFTKNLYYCANHIGKIYGYKRYTPKKNVSQFEDNFYFSFGWGDEKGLPNEPGILWLMDCNAEKPRKDTFRVSSEILMYNWKPNFVPPNHPKRDTNESRNRKMKSWQIDTVFSCDIHNILSLMKNLKTLQPILPKHINFPQKKYFFFSKIDSKFVEKFSSTFLSICCLFLLF